MGFFVFRGDGTSLMVNVFQVYVRTCPEQRSKCEIVSPTRAKIRRKFILLVQEMCFLSARRPK